MISNPRKRANIRGSKDFVKKEVPLLVFAAFRIVLIDSPSNKIIKGHFEVKFGGYFKDQMHTGPYKTYCVYFRCAECCCTALNKRSTLGFWSGRGERAGNGQPVPNVRLRTPPTCLPACLDRPSIRAAFSFSFRCSMSARATRGSGGETCAVWQ